MKELKKINQTELKSLFKERIENPGKYVSRPLLVWESLIRDGIQERILEEVFSETNKKMDKKNRLWYKTMIPMMGPSLFGEASKREYLEEPTVIRHEDSLHEDSWNDEDYGKYNAGLIVIDLPVILDGEWLGEFKNLLDTHKWEGIDLPKLPLVVYMSRRDDKLGDPSDYPDAEQYIFEPDFEEWSVWARKKGYPEFILEFIRGNGDKEEILYRWYNFFRNNHFKGQYKREGCSSPQIWDRLTDGLHKLSNRKGISDIEKLMNTTDLRIILPVELYDEFIEYIQNH